MLCGMAVNHVIVLIVLIMYMMYEMELHIVEMKWHMKEQVQRPGG